MTFNITPEWKKELKRMWWLLLIPISIILKELASAFPDIVERVFANGIFPAVSYVVSWIFGWMPFSFVEFLFYTLLALLISWIIYNIVKAVKRSFDLKKFVHTLVTFGIIVGISFNAFYFMWGFNYFRYSIAYSMDLEVKERTPQELADLCVMLANTANYMRENVEEDENGVFTLPEGKIAAMKKIPSAYESLGKVYPQFSRTIPAPKPVASSKLMSIAGISGIFVPFTEESNVNVDQLDLLLPSSAAHESAHLMGIAREDEANFVACIASGDPATAYSGVMLALINAGNALHDISPDAYNQLYGYYSDGVKRDLDAHRAYWDQYKGQAEETVSKINDSYLKQQKQSDGVMSYGRMVDLLLAYFSNTQA